MSPPHEERAQNDEFVVLVSTEQSLGMDAEPKIPSAIEGLETFSLGDTPVEPDEETGDILDAESNGAK